MTFLLIFVTLVILVFAFIAEYMSVICRKIRDLILPDTNAESRLQLTNLQDELKSLSIVNEFARYARIERRVIKLTDDIRASSRKKSEALWKVKLATQVFYHVTQVFVMLSLIVKYRSEALLQLPVGWLHPFAYFISFPSGIQGAVGITVWLLVCRSVLPRLVKNFYPCRPTGQLASVTSKTCKLQ